MKLLLNKLYSKEKDVLVQDILFQYEYDGSVIINFLYFSLIVAHKLFYSASSKNNIQKNYKRALLKGDFLLPDGIALQLFYFFARLFKKISGGKEGLYFLNNLNGTDFVPYFLHHVKKHNGSQSLCILLYGTKNGYLDKAAQYLRSQGYNVVYTHEGFSDLDWQEVSTALETYQDTINVLLVGRSTPTHPIQELWAEKNRKIIKESRLIVMNVGGLLDFWAGAQKRAPLFLRKIKLEWLYRLVMDPKRNIKKVWNSFSLFRYIFRYLLLKKG